MVPQFGPYQVLGLIARDGMGEIFRAYDTRHDRVVALKLLAEQKAVHHPRSLDSSAWRTRASAVGAPTP